VGHGIDSTGGERPPAGGAAFWPGAAARAGVLAGLFLLLWLAVRPGFIYRIAPPFPVFRLGARFAADFLPHPGGPVDYAAAFLSQFFLWHWAGALITVGVAAALAAALWLFLRTAFGVKPAWLHLAPLVLVPLLTARYAHHVSAVLAMLTALTAAAAWAGLGRRRRLLGLAAFVPIAVLVYWLSCGAVLLFGVLCSLSELAERRWLTAGLCLAVAACAPVVLGMLVFRERPVHAWARLVPAYRLVFREEPGEPLVRLVAVYRYAEPVAGALMAALWLYVIGVAVWSAVRKSGRAGRAVARTRVVPWLAVGLLAALAVLAGTNRSYGRVLSLDCYVRRSMWPEVLTTARKIEQKRYSLIVALTVNLALAHTGRLNDDLLAYHPTPQSLVRTPEEFLPPVGRPYDGPTPRAFMRLSDIYYDLGRVNESEQMVCEALEAQGDRPWLVERLAVINLTKEKWAAASRYIDLLALDPVYRCRASELDALLGDREAAAREPEIARLRALRPLGPDRGERTVEGMLAESIRRSPTNEMAVEYLMAYDLLTANLEGVVANAGRLAALHDGRIPRLCEEAMAIYKQVNGAEAGFEWDLISEATRKRFAAFSHDMAAAGGEPGKAGRALAAKYGDSYLLYYAVNAMSEEGQ
jgi:hypothetical protein